MEIAPKGFIEISTGPYTIYLRLNHLVGIIIHKDRPAVLRILTKDGSEYEVDREVMIELFKLLAETEK